MRFSVWIRSKVRHSESECAMEGSLGGPCYIGGFELIIYFCIYVFPYFIFVESLKRGNSCFKSIVDI